jgi:hypothetical protein
MKNLLSTIIRYINYMNDWMKRNIGLKLFTLDV